MQKRPVKKPILMHGCETCDFRDGEFWVDTIDQSITRCYCKARHFAVDAEMMSKDCDFYRIDPTQIKPKEDSKYGL